MILDKGGVAKKLVGHRSRISKMKLYGNRLLSASYDGNLNLWIADREKVEPMPLLTINNWIMHSASTRRRIPSGWAMPKAI